MWIGCVTAQQKRNGGKGLGTGWLGICKSHVEWLEVSDTMPAYDIVIYASYADSVTDPRQNPQRIWIYDVTGMKQQRVQRGLNILRNEDGTIRKVRPIQ